MFFHLAWAKPGVDYPGFTRGVNLFAWGLPPGTKRLLRRGYTRICNETCRLPLKFAQRRVNPGRACKIEKFTLSGAPHRRKARRHQETAQTAREGGDYWNSREADAGRREEKAREASKVIFNSPGGRKGPCGQARRPQETRGTAWEAAGTQERTISTAGRHQGGTTSSQ